ncbi:MAG: NAD(P)H-hydrate epimerase, partial [Specibacter sp.]
MLSAHSAAAVRAAEQPLLAAGRGPELMRAAAHGLAMGVVSILRTRGRGVYGANVVLLIGSGNNGGDALFAGAYLAARGARTTALLTGARTHAEALAAYEKAGGRCVAPAVKAPAGNAAGVRAAAAFFAEARAADVVVDGLLGTGGRG